MNDDRTVSLEEVPLFYGLDAEALGALQKHYRRRSFAEGEVLFHEGDPGEAFYVVLSGLVNFHRIGSEGEIVHIGQCGPGDHFGEMAILDGMPRWAEGVTAAPCEMLIANRADFLRSLEQYPRIDVNLRHRLLARLRCAADLIAGLQKPRSTNRLSAFLLEAVESLGIEDPAGGRRIAAPLTQQHIAERIGATCETVDQALTELKEAGAVRCSDGYLVVVNRKKLRRYCMS